MIIIFFMQARDVEQVSRTATTYRNSSQVARKPGSNSNQGATIGP